MSSVGESPPSKGSVLQGTAAGILVVDGNGLFRSLVKSTIRHRYPNVGVLEAHGLEDALTQAAYHRPWLILADIALHGRRVLNLPQRLRRVNPGGVVVILTAYDFPDYRKVLMAEGAHHFLSKLRVNRGKLMEIIAEELARQPVVNRASFHGRPETQVPKVVTGRGIADRRLLSTEADESRQASKDGGGWDDKDDDAEPFMS